MGATQVTGLSMDSDTMKALDAEIERQRRAFPGRTITRSGVIRELVLEGLKRRKKSRARS